MIIGITASRFCENKNDFYKTNSSYISFLRELGTDIVMLPCENGISMLSAVDGLILSGGYDVNPLYYGEKRQEVTHLADDKQDLYEMSLVHAAIRCGLPVLGICRGIQVINVALGGTLVQNCNDHYGNLHSVQIKNSSLLADGCICVNSFHHQRVGKVGDLLKVTGITFSGDIEMIEHKKAPLFGVQWHPEKQYGGGVIETFLNLCQK
ncbi:MAG: gamma-glutamyl-gamma-aminobutyrate hydrolase family protein [Clostridia bacterium]|nr:gamma-glutamyl-gamma-aminobutyrate hydrolase family protein [Clostridia bacterium]